MIVLKYLVLNIIRLNKKHIWQKIYFVFTIKVMLFFVWTTNNKEFKWPISTVYLIFLRWLHLSIRFLWACVDIIYEIGCIKIHWICPFLQILFQYFLVYFLTSLRLLIMHWNLFTVEYKYLNTDFIHVDNGFCQIITQSIRLINNVDRSEENCYWYAFLNFNVI